MNAKMNLLRTLILEHMDPAHFKLDDQQVCHWLRELPLIREQICSSMQEEMLGTIDNSLVERHIKQIQCDCIYLADVLYKYLVNRALPMALYTAAGTCLEQLLDHIDTRYERFFTSTAALYKSKKEESSRIRVLFSVDALAYFFKLLQKAGGLDAGPITQLILAISRNFITPGIGDGSISPNSLSTKYKQVVQRTAVTVRKLLVKMLKVLDEEFDMT